MIDARKIAIAAIVLAAAWALFLGYMRLSNHLDVKMVGAYSYVNRNQEKRLLLEFELTNYYDVPVTITQFGVFGGLTDSFGEYLSKEEDVMATFDDYGRHLILSPKESIKAYEVVEFPSTHKGWENNLKGRIVIDHSVYGRGKMLQDTQTIIVLEKDIKKWKN